MHHLEILFVVEAIEHLRKVFLMSILTPQLQKKKNMRPIFVSE